MTEKQVRERLAQAKPAETPICCLYLVAAVFESPPPTIIYDPAPRYMADQRKANDADTTVDRSEVVHTVQSHDG